MKKQTKSPALSKASALLLLSAIPSFASALYIQVSPAELFGRQDSTCGDSSYKQCTTAGLPDDFCCPSDNSCIALAGKTTALCCPAGNDCTAVRPIPCDVSLQDKSLHPENVVMTNALTGSLPKCAGMCCPFGYSCDGGGNCIQNSDQNAKPITTGAQSSSTTAPSTAKSSETVGVTTAPQQSASATASATSSGSDAASATATDSDSESSSSSTAAAAAGESDSSSSGPSAGLVAGGVVGGIAAAVFLGMLVWFFVKRETKRKNDAEKEPPRSSRSSSFGNIINNPMTNSLRAGGCPVISKPIVDEGAMRSDFGRKVSTRTGSFQSGSDEDADYERDFGTMGELGRPVSDVDMTGLHSVPRSPPRITNPRAVSSMYGEQGYLDPHNSAYQAPLKMPSARQFGGQDNRVSVGAEDRDAMGSPISDYGGQPVQRDPNGAYIDVFADSNVPLTPPQPSHAGDRMTSFTDIMDESQGRRR
ncbi:hypothetical protein INS49_008653 [Diaporthe citri]|uniref:uncharacterized protein n=1 Tax=Diaporthe citri TaxID=83186 RepID=UPI001C7E8777|nr:uncharacterized protein INS49_008653 [Diaporthe citri]KAG6363552.1 hypothetical protein INS49_008653 [Diaporthe citri]